MTMPNLIGTTAGLALFLAALPLAAQEKPKEIALKKLTESLEKLVKEADADGNGTIKRSEFTAFEAAARKSADALLNEADPTIAEKKAAKDLKKYDANGDGKLDEAETKTRDAEAALKAIKDFDWDEDGKLGEREKTAMQWAEEGRVDGVFRRLDTDGKGELTAAQLSAALGELTKLVKKK
jgi:Ca2+-binding EF-hand superfamily protein